jgi:hypothetical protein
MTDISNYTNSGHSRSKTLTKNSHFNFKDNKVNKKSAFGHKLYTYENGYKNHSRHKSYSKKPLKLSNTSDLSNLLSKHVVTKNH